MKISQNGINFIKQEEGFRPRLYRDTAGFWTCGYGHKVLATDNFIGKTLSEPEATDLLLKDVDHVEVYLTNAQPSLNQNQFDALSDFGFNLGVGSLHDLLSHGLDEVPTQILRWDHSAGKVVKGLLARRERELALWNTPC